jgi:hypothetical protein
MFGENTAVKTFVVFRNNISIICEFAELCMFSVRDSYFRLSICPLLVHVKDWRTQAAAWKFERACEQDGV